MEMRRSISPDTQDHAQESRALNRLTTVAHSDIGDMKLFKWDTLAAKFLPSFTSLEHLHAPLRHRPSESEEEVQKLFEHIRQKLHFLPALRLHYDRNVSDERLFVPEMFDMTPGDMTRGTAIWQFEG